MNIEKLIPIIEKQAKKLNRALWEDLTVIGLIKVWLLVRNDRQVEEPLLVKAAKDAMIDYLRRERCHSKVVQVISDKLRETVGVELPYLELGFQAAELEQFLNSLKPTLRRAIRKRLNGKALSSAERMALLRFRKSGKFRKLIN